MHYYLLESMAPLVFRSGKPFGSQADVKDVAFPLPSSAAGLMRTQHIQQTHCPSRNAISCPQRQGTDWN